MFAVMVVWRITGKIIRIVLCYIVYQTRMSRSISLLICVCGFCMFFFNKGHFISVIVSFVFFIHIFSWLL